MILLANQLRGLTPHVPAIASRLVTRPAPGNADLEAQPLFGAGGSSPQNSIPRWNLGTSHLGGETPRSIRQQDHLFPGGLAGNATLPARSILDSKQIIC
jgi:hypothetical protein